MLSFVNAYLETFSIKKTKICLISIESLIFCMWVSIVVRQTAIINVHI